MRIRRPCGIVAPLLALALAACHRGPADLGACSDSHSDANTLVAACTKLIDGGRLDDADFATARMGRARGYALLKQDSSALADLDALIAREPDNALAYSFRGAVHGNDGDLDLALADFRQELRIDPRNDRAWQDIGKAYNDKRDYPQAQDAFSHAIELNSKSAFALNGRCWARAVVGRELDEAMADCDRSLQFAPGEANTLNSRAFVHFRKKQYAEAIGDDTASIARDRSIASSFYVRGLGKLATGDTAGAEGDLATARGLEPGVAQRYATYGIAPADR